MEVDGSRNALDNKSEEDDFTKKGSSDPVVYQLVRVEGDGTLVPATEDEVLQFEHFLHDEKVDLPPIEDVGHVEEYFRNDCMLLKKSDLEEGSSKLETREVGAQKLGDGLEENRLQSLDDSFSPLSKCTVVRDQRHGKLHTEQGDSITQQDNTSTETTITTALNDSCISEKDKADACLGPVDDTCAGSSVSGVANSVPDFSILRGEVCLDDLTIRELQEAFRATFGRQTTVKDKLWLKRRIAMGLTNSCDVPSSGCVVKDYKIIGKDDKQEIPNMEEVELQATSLVRDQITHPGDGDSPSSSYYQSEDQQGSYKRLKRVPTSNNEQQGTNKRTRKPTKRYIEELSDIETRDSTGKLSSPAKRHLHDEVFLKQRITSYHEVNSLRKLYPTRKDTLGGFSVQVPYVSRMRRGRPRKDFISFVDNEPSVEGSGVQTAIGVMLEKDGEGVNNVRKAFEVPPMVNAEKGRHLEAAGKRQAQNLQANGYNSKFKHKTTHASKRMHHRAWTLCEVMKLVDGVARFGAGKWSEIRKLAFASYSYRTSVDLKDKWRNLIRASQTQLSTGKDGVSPRKLNPSIIPIPPPILLRVKELHELQSREGGFTGPMKISGQNGKVVQGKGSGFL